MELPITKPSKVSYADELDFSELLEKMSEKEYDGFIRITHGSEEGYILFKDGNQVAASYDRYLKNDAMEKIFESMKKTDTLVEVFDLKASQVDYLIDLNKAYKLEIVVETEPEPKKEYIEEYSGYEEDYFNPKEASYRKSAEQLRAEEELAYERKLAAEKTAKLPLESESESEPESESKSESELKTEKIKVETVVESEPTKTEPLSPEVSEPEKSEPLIQDEKPVLDEIESKIEPEIELEKEVEVKEKEKEKEVEIAQELKSAELEPEIETTEALDETVPESESISEDLIEEEAVPIDRSELMKKYGLRDIEEEEVDKMLETYKGGTVSSADLERIELTIMNRVKQSVMGIPKINGVEVIVFLENARELGGKIKIIAEYEGKGLFSRIMGDSKAIENLKYQILEIAEMEIRKSFREYPQIVENFDIGIEIH